MLREKLMHHEPIDGFRWRSHEITRIEGFSDAVFGFAVTLLIVSLEVPRTSTELLETMRGFGAFVATFVILVGIWRAQFIFFRRYALEDTMTVNLNLVLLFTVLFFVYPLKFLFRMLITNLRTRAMVETAHGLVPAVLPEHKKWIFMIFAVGYTAVFTLFALLYRHAYNQREKLALNEFEIFETQHSIRRMTLVIFVGLSYFAVALLESLPHGTPSEKRIVLVTSAVTLAIFGGLLLQLVRLTRERRRVKKEWIARSTTVEPPSGVRLVKALSADEMLKAVASEAGKASVFIGAAAIADYRPAQRAEQKIKKSNESITLTLERTPDVLSQVAASRANGMLVVGFAAETENVLENAKEKLRSKKLDAIVANDVSRADSGFDTATNAITIITDDDSVELPLMSKREAADRVLDAIVRIRHSR